MRSCSARCPSLPKTTVTSDSQHGFGQVLHHKQELIESQGLSLESQRAEVVEQGVVVVVDVHAYGWQPALVLPFCLQPGVPSSRWKYSSCTVWRLWNRRIRASLSASSVLAWGAEPLRGTIGCSATIMCVKLQRFLRQTFTDLKQGSSTTATKLQSLWKCSSKSEVSLPIAIQYKSIGEQKGRGGPVWFYKWVAVMGGAELAKFILFNRMELYHQTLVRPLQIQRALAAHLLPIKPREEQEKPKQLLFARTSSLELFHYVAIKQMDQRYQLRSFFIEEIFSDICAVQAVEYLDEDMKKDLIIVSLINGKYQLLEWMPQSSRLSLRDQGFIFGQEEEVQSGLCKPVPGHYISVNNDAKMVMIASAHWHFKIYTQSLGFAGLRLEPLLAFQQPFQTPSICLQLSSGGKDFLFYSLRLHADEIGKRMKVHRITRKGQTFEEESIPLEDSSAHMLITREGDSFLAIGKQNATYYSQGKSSLVKLSESPQCLQCCFFRRIRDKKEEVFTVNQHGQLLLITFDTNNCNITQVQKIFVLNQVVPLQRNLFFGLSASEDNYMFHVGCRWQARRGREEEFSNPKHPQIKELEILASFPGPRVVKDMKVASMEKGAASQLVITGGRCGSKKGFVSVLKYGLKVKQYLNVNFVSPIGAWCLKRSNTDRHHSYIVFSFSNRKTSCYLFENNMLSHTNELRLDESETSLHVNKLADGSIVQVTASKIRHIQNHHRDICIKGRIMKAACLAEGRQLVILLIGGFMEYYELNNNGELKLVNEFNLDSEANFIDFAPPDSNDSRALSKLIVIGKTNYNISIFTLEGKGLQLKRSRNMKCLMQSLTILSEGDNYQLVIGTNTGKMIKLLINNRGEQLSDQEEIPIGEKTVRFSKITILNKLNLIRLCPDPALSYHWQGQQQLCTLPLPSVDFVTQIAIAGLEKSCIFMTYFDNYLRFVEISGFENLLQQFQKDIQHTGRKILLCEDRIGVLSESKERRAGKEVWRSVFCLFNPSKNYFLEKYLQFQADEKCISVCYVPRGTGKGHLCFGCVTDYQTYPVLRAQKPCIKVYSYEKDKDPLLTLLYRFAIDDLPTAMEVYLDKLLVGVGRKLIMYDIFGSKLLLRAVRPNLGSYLNNIAVEGEKIITSEVFNSFIVYRLNMPDKSFDYIGEDILPRFLSASHILDGNYGVIAGADKFGSFFVSKFSEKIKTEFESGGQSKYNEFTDSNKLESMVACNMGEVITSIQTGKLDERKPQSIFYSTIDGRIAMFYPFESDQIQQHELLVKLQKELSTSTLTCATNHDGFRSFYSPCKGVIDGDFCKLYQNLSENEKEKIANALLVETKDISALLATMDNKFK